MAKICFPHHACGEFSSLNEAFRYLRKREYGWSWFTLTEIVKCNVHYRDYLRENGIDSLIKKIIEEVPELARDDKALKYLREWALKEKITKTIGISRDKANELFCIMSLVLNYMWTLPVTH